MSSHEADPGPAVASPSPSPFRAAVERVQAAAAAAEEAQRDPAIRAAIDADLNGRRVHAPELERAFPSARERDWAARGIPERLWPMLNAGAPPPPGTPPDAAGTAGPGAPRPTKALEVVGRFLSPSDPMTGLVLAGIPGTGKTVAAAWGAAWGCGRLVKALDLVRAGLYPEDAGFWPRLHAAKLLVIDDLGTEPLDAKGFGLAAICDLVDRRYDAERKTIITTNYSLEEFRGRYATGAGARLWGRIFEVFRFVEFTQADVVRTRRAEGR